MSPGWNSFLVCFVGVVVSGSGRKTRECESVSQTTEGLSKTRKLLSFVLSVLIVTVLGFLAYLVFFPKKPGSKVTFYSNTHPQAKVERKAKSLKDLLAMSPEQLAEVDIAEMNLLCASGLPGAENLDVSKKLSRLDEYASCVRYWTNQSMPAFHENPDKYDNSEAKFRVLLLISVLQKEYGVHYNYRGERNCDFTDSKNPFIHGLIDDSNGGTCASMPIMYVAVGRRLGYPMRLVLAKTHIFARWDDGKERFNIEGTNPRFNYHPDSYYCNPPYPKISDAELKQGWYLKSLTPAEELAVFLQNRANCLMDNNRFKEAEQAFTRSYQLAPQNPFGRQQIASAIWARRAAHRKKIRVARTSLLDDGFPIPNPSRARTLNIEQINAMNRANMQRRMRISPPTSNVPYSHSPHRVNFPRRP